MNELNSSKVARKRTLIVFIVLSVLSFALPVVVFGADAIGVFPTLLDEYSGVFLGISFAAMVALTGWALVEAIKKEERTGEPGIWLGFFFLTGPIGAFIFLLGQARDKDRPE